MTEPARKPVMDIDESDRAARAPAPQRAIDDPLAELARLVADPSPPRPTDALSPASRAVLTDDERAFLDELSLAVDRVPARPTLAPISPFAPKQVAPVSPVAAASEPAPHVPPFAEPFSFSPPEPAPAAPTPVLDDPLGAPLDEPLALRGGYEPQLFVETPAPEASASRALPAAAFAYEAPSVEPTGGVAAHGDNLDADMAQAAAAAVARPTVAPFELPVRKRVEAQEGAGAPPVYAPRDLDEEMAAARAPAHTPGETPAETPVAEAETAAPAPRRSGLFGLSRAAMIAAVLGVGAVTVGGVLALRGGGKATTGEPPLIQASKQPVKVAPPAAAPAPAASTDGKPAEDAGARPASGAEEPLDLAREAQTRVKAIAVGPDGQPTGKALSAAPPAAEPGSSLVAAGFPEPKRVRTVTVRPDGSLVGAAPAAPVASPAPAAVIPPPPIPTAPVAAAPIATPVASAPAAPPRAQLEEGAQTPPARPKVATAPVAAPRTPSAAASPKPPTVRPAAPPAAPRPVAATPAPAAEPADQPSDVVQVRPLFSDGPAAAPRASNEPLRLAPETTASAPRAAPARVAAAEPADDAGGSYAVQLAASPSEQEARAAAQRMTSRFGGELGGRSAAVRKAEVSGKTVYRVRVGGMSKEGAAALCGRLQSAGGNCFIARN